MELKKTVRIAMFLAISIVLAMVESFIPILNGAIPGIKIGLANIVVVTVLYLYGFKDAVKVSLLRVFLMGILRTGLFGMTFFFSLFGSILSISAMGLTKKTHLSIVGVSVVGAVSHGIGQMLVAILLIKNYNLFYYLPFIMIFSVISGIMTGFISKECVKNLEENC